MVEPRIAGVVLAGGQSRRMGRDKAMLVYHGEPLVAHMAALLRAGGVDDVLVSGMIDGYDCIADDIPAAGPVGGIASVLRARPHYDRYVFVPVDMPVLPVAALRVLAGCAEGGYFEGWPLPACLVPARFTAPLAAGGAMRDLLAAQGVAALPCPPVFDSGMKNINTPQEWAEVLAQQ